MDMGSKFCQQVKKNYNFSIPSTTRDLEAEQSLDQQPIDVKKNYISVQKHAKKIFIAKS